MPTFRKLVPMLQTKDIGKTVAWYETVLGFQRTSQHVDGWCSLSRDGVSIMFMNNAASAPGRISSSPREWGARRVKGLLPGFE
jgi:hypothetical protein